MSKTGQRGQFREALKARYRYWEFEVLRHNSLLTKYIKQKFPRVLITILMVLKTINEDLGPTIPLPYLRRHPGTGPTQKWSLLSRPWGRGVFQTTWGLSPRWSRYATAQQQAMYEWTPHSPLGMVLQTTITRTRSSFSFCEKPSFSVYLLLHL